MVIRNVWLSECNMGGKSASKLIHSLKVKNFEFLNLRNTKTIQYIGLTLLGTVNHAVPF